jgi:diguanylate cyclase (GGDEF)-like protein
MSNKRADRAFAVRLMEHLVVPTFVLDPDGRLIIWNRACEQLTGVRATDVLGTKNHWTGFYDAPRPCLADLVLEGASGKLLYEQVAPLGSDRAALSAENWCVMPQLASRRYLAIDAGPIYSEAGELLGVVETLRDITAQHEAQQSLKALASSDGLTGLANRRSFDQTLERECRRANRTGQPLSLLMIDIDHFKSLNDHLGHQAGDDCLKQIASILGGELLRPGDFAARYGGEEFVVILPATPVQGAEVVASRLLTAVDEFAIPNPVSPHGILTLSIGVAGSSRRCALGPVDLVRAADQALYRAKRGGRNRIVSDSTGKRSAA